MYPISTVLIFICRTEQYCETFFGTGSIWGRGGYLGRTAEFDLLPERLTFTYLSQFENKFYQLDEALPTDKIRPMMAKSYRVV